MIDNRVAWACSYGLLEAGTDHWVLPENAFQAASVSKPVSSIGFLRLVQDNQIGLDDSVVNRVGWNLTRRGCSQQAWMNAVTLRNLLPHMGGIIGRDTTDPNPAGSCTSFNPDGFGGFGGYPNTPGVQVPTIDQVLSGSAPANSPKVELTHQPATAFTIVGNPNRQSNSSYSGGAYVYMQRLLQNLRGTDLNAWMTTNVFTPAGMTHSTYQLEPAALAPAAGHDGNGAVSRASATAIRSRRPRGSTRRRRTSAQLIIMWNQQGQVNGHTILDATRADDMRVRSLGLPSSNVNTNDWTCWHNGANYGFRCEFYAYPTAAPATPCSRTATRATSCTPRFTPRCSGSTAGHDLTSAASANIFAMARIFSPMSPHLTRREAQIMEILHRRRRATVEEIRAELPDAPSPSSVRKLLEIMIDRRLLGREYDGPRFVYFPAARPEDASRSALKQLVRTFFDNSPGSAAAALLDMAGEPIVGREYKRLSALLRRGA